MIAEDKNDELKSRELTEQYSAAQTTLTHEQQEFMDSKLGSKLWRMNNLYTIRDKNGVKRILTLNHSQNKVLTQFKHNRKIILKSRQQGISTLFLAYYLDDCLFKPGFQAGIQSYGQDEAEKLSDRALLMWEDLDPDVKTLLNLKLVANNSKRMMFSNGSILKIGNFRGDTLQGLHVSELGKIAKKYPDKAKELKTGAFQAVGKDNKITIESTAEGRNGLFYEMWLKAYNKAKLSRDLNQLEFQAVFLSWVEDPDCNLSSRVDINEAMREYFTKVEQEYGITLTNSQKWWYASKYEELGYEIKQEYPTTPEEAFEQSLEGSIYKKEYDALYSSKRVLPNLHYHGLPVLVTYDIGVNDETVLIFSQVVDGVPRVIDCYAASGENLEHYVEVMWALKRDKGYDIQDVALPHDAMVREFSTGKTRLEKFLELGVPARVLKRISIDDGISATRDFLNVALIDDSCETLLLAIQQYHWKYDTRLGVSLRTPEHDWTSNYTDSLRYTAIAANYNKKELLTDDEMGYPDDYYQDDEYSGL